MAIFSLDFDGTYTLDPEMWNEWVILAQARGHIIYCVTLRSPTYSVEVLGSIGADRCIFTSSEGKKEFTKQLNIDIDVWIDDIPEFI